MTLDIVPLYETTSSPHQVWHTLSRDHTVLHATHAASSLSTAAYEIATIPGTSPENSQRDGR